MKGLQPAEGMKPMTRITFTGIAAALLASAGAAAAAGTPQSPAKAGELILYQEPNFNGDDYTIDRTNTNIHTDWDVRSIAIFAGDKWQICNKPRLQGDCITLTQSLPDATKIGVMGQVPSAKRIDK
jgi:hypothetical protein